MAFGNREMPAGDPTAVALGPAFLPDPRSDDDRAATEVRESWGAFTVWDQEHFAAVRLLAGGMSFTLLPRDDQT